MYTWKREVTKKRECLERLTLVISDKAILLNMTQIEIKKV